MTDDAIPALIDRLTHNIETQRVLIEQTAIGSLEREAARLAYAAMKDARSALLTPSPEPPSIVTGSDERAIPAGMKPWDGGDAAPADWDGGPVLLRNCSTMFPSKVSLAYHSNGTNRWNHRRENKNPDWDIIAYTPAASSDERDGVREGEPVAWCSPGQFAAMGPDPIDEGGATYLPIRRTSAGLFTMPLFATPKPPVDEDVEALAGYRAAVSFIAADAWDGCSDCIEVLRAARAADWRNDQAANADETARHLARIRQHGRNLTAGGAGA